MLNDKKWMHAVGISAVVVVLAEPSWAVERFTGGYENAQPMIVIGSATGNPSFTADDAIDANSPLSPFAGVVSIFASDNGSTGALGTGVAISRRHILTAAHVVDYTGSLRPFGSDWIETGDGVVDAVPSLSNVILNAGAEQWLNIESIQVHPAWHGFMNPNAPPSEASPSLNDDLAIITLAEDLPASVPVYSLSSTPFEFITPIVMVGYGRSGEGDVGFTGDASFTVKRYGFNIATLYDQDDEFPHELAEVFFFDFDGPTNATDLDSVIGLGNDGEATIGPGDSGGPSFIHSDLNDDGMITADELIVFGINTFGLPGVNDTPLFGSWGGGMIVSSYLDFIATVIPEPAMGSLAFGMVFLLGRRRRN